MEKMFNESSSNFTFHFEGTNEIYVDTFAKVIENVQSAIQIISCEEDPEAFFKLKISRFRPGSFIVDLLAIVSTANTIINSGNLDVAKKVTDVFLNVFNIKKALKGEKPKKLEYIEDKAKVTNIDDETVTVPDTAAKVYFQNEKMDNTIINIINVISNDSDRSGFSICQDSDNATQINKEDFSNMSKKIVTDKIITKNTWENEIETNLLLRKPDLLGDSKWGFYFNKNIDATIKDEDWLSKVHKGEIVMSAGVKIPVRLLVEVDMDECNLPIKDSERYTILEVIGEIISPQKDKQLNIEF